MRPDEDVRGNLGQDGAAVDSRGQAEIEGRAGAAGSSAPGRGAEPPPAGPHEKPGLTDPAATPGTGALPGPSPDDEADAATC